MIQPGGGAEGPYVENAGSSCRDKNFTPLVPGRDGGLSTVDYQPAPDPDGAKPGLTAQPTGTYDGATERYVLEWSSQIVGGPFNNFTGVWHLEGTFEAR